MAPTESRDLNEEAINRFTLQSVARMIQLGEEQLRSDTPIHPDDIAIGMLASEIHRQVQTRRSLLEIGFQFSSQRVNGGWKISMDRPPFTNGIHAWDEAFAADLEKNLGTEGEQIAGIIRSRAKERADQFAHDNRPVPLWRLWLPDPTHECCPYLTLLGITVWIGMIRDEYMFFVEKPPAIMSPILESIALAHQRGVHLAPNGAEKPELLAKDSRFLAIMDRKHTSLLPPIPRIEADMALAMLQQSIPQLSSLTAQRVIRWEIFEGYKQRQLMDPRVINIPGGWAHIAEEIKLKSHDAVEQVRLIILAQAYMCFRLPGKGDRTANLLSYVEKKSVGGQEPYVQLVLGTILMPGHIYDYAKEDFAWPSEFFSARKLVPVLDLPPFVGRHTDWEPQAALSTWIVVEMRRQAKYIEQHGSAHIDENNMKLLAERASLPAALLPKVIDRWCQDGTDEPAFLRQPEKDHYTLSENYAKEWLYLVRAGQSEHSASKSGKRQVIQRWKRQKAKEEKWAKQTGTKYRKDKKK